MKIYSERFLIKYLFSNFGLCLGVDTKKTSFLFLISKAGIIMRRRPVGDKIVENLNYEIPEIHAAILTEKKTL
ncbi:MAG: hypothetical protein M1393_08080 [Candidatus Thermoplasmatota archaeon]|nr:hypothetical protein [Candidatus Thermoplasmatota archaeon]